jgi:hypothetical protein
MWAAFFSTCFMPTLIQCATLRMHTEVHRIYVNHLLYFMLPKKLYNTENKVARNLRFLRLVYILTQYILKNSWNEEHNPNWKFFFDTYDLKVSDGFISPG